MRRTFVLLALLALLAGGSASAQTGGLRVVVTDSATKAPLPGAEVVLASADRHVATTSARTNSGGAVDFPVLRPAGYTIEVRLAGDAPLSLSDVRVPAGGIAVLPVALFPELQESLQVNAAREFGLSQGRVFGLTLEGFNLLNDDTLQVVEIWDNVATSIRRFGRRLQVGLRYAF